jgi:ATP-dependent RNA helicase SUPV3L1/SUV3
MAQVYETAERLRAMRGGAAVVLGALSPRTRNAQVAMFQAGEVDYLVATDAIGMGLNLDVSHVAFAATRKFDGQAVRDLDDAELAQIAGRAGRYLQDGTFGTVLPLALPGSVAAAIELHRFPALRHVQWRNSALDFASVEALEASLRAPPKLRGVRLARGAEDTAALERLLGSEDVVRRARGEDRVRLLWEVCTVPDFRRLLFESHVAFLEELFAELTSPRGKLHDAWIAPRVMALDDVEGDVDTLVARIAAVRTWTYVAHQAGWVLHAGEWQEKTRAIEDRLSDALHERLVRRFVDHHAKPRRARARPVQRAPEAPVEVEVEVAASHPFAKLRALRDALAPQKTEAPAPVPLAVEEVIDAPHERFTLEARGSIAHDARPIAALSPGPSIVLPEVRLVGQDDLGAGARARLLRRLTAYVRDVVGALLAPLRAVAGERSISAGARGLLYRLEQGLGTALADPSAPELTPDERAVLEAHGVAAGASVAYVARLLRADAVPLRATLASVHYLRGRRFVAAPAAGRVSIVPERGIDPRVYAAIGFPVAGPRAVRADVLERVASAGATEVETVASWLGCSAKEAARVVAAVLKRPQAPPS